MSRNSNFTRHRQVAKQGPRENYSQSRQNSRPPQRGKHVPKVFSDHSKFINKLNLVEQEAAYTAQHTFRGFNFHPTLQQNIERKGYLTPSPIQDQSIPLAMQNLDVLGIANTGTGKTAAFLLPLIQKIIQNPQERVLILAPTRELTVQINDEFRAFTQNLQIFSVVCIGGASINVQMQQLRRRYNVIIATPGRLKDLIQQRCVDLSQTKNVVLDEVDQMFDMGFVRDIQYILGLLPKVRQSLFFSATLSKEIDALVKAHMHNPSVVSLKKRDTAATVHQDIVRVSNPLQKIDVLHDLLIQQDYAKVLIFGRTKRGVHRLAQHLHERGFKVDAIHGDKSQSARQHALTKFKQDHIQVLVATDVAARGIDIPDVSHVINYELPETYEDYIHRIGRTGRANKLGKALTFVD